MEFRFKADENQVCRILVEYTIPMQLVPITISYEFESHSSRGVLDTKLCDIVSQWPADGRFSQALQQ